MCRRRRQRKEGFTMTKIDIVSGFLGAGKTTLIKKLLAEAFQGEKLVLIENEFGEISIDGGFLKESGVQISEMSSGCICCSLVGDFNKALKDVHQQFAPDRILIEPSGVGKLSDVIVAVDKECLRMIYVMLLPVGSIMLYLLIQIVRCCRKRKSMIFSILILPMMNYSAI